MEDDEPRHLLEMRFARQPDLLEFALRAFAHFEPVHRDEHASAPQLGLGSEDSEAIPHAQWFAAPEIPAA
jgi:hypothetical protein